MSTQHTPGPWFVAKADEPMESDGLIVESPNGYEIRPDGHQRLGDELADLSLIAAAPDLLEALQSVWLWMENQADAQSKGGHATFDLMMLREQRDIASAAIAKATGEQ